MKEIDLWIDVMQLEPFCWQVRLASSSLLGKFGGWLVLRLQSVAVTVNETPFAGFAAKDMRHPVRPPG